MKKADLLSSLLLVVALNSSSLAFANSSSTTEKTNNTISVTQTLHKTINIDGVEIFYREAGTADAPTILLLHGFPTSRYFKR